MQETFVEVFLGELDSHGSVGSIKNADRKTVSRKKRQVQYRMGTKDVMKLTLVLLKYREMLLLSSIYDTK